MRGIEGDPALEHELRAALERVLHVFPEHLARPQPPVAFEAAELVQNARFDAILAAHRKDRLTLPIQALRSAGAPYHGFERMRPRRLAWFVPSLLASWLDRAPAAGDEPFGASDLEALVGEGWEWTDEEHAALGAFFEVALDAALATPLRRAHEPAQARPLEDGVRVWSLHSPSLPLEILRVANALHVPLDALAARWALDPSPLALDHLLEAVFDTTVASKHYLSHEAVADRLDEAFFAATGEHQERLAKAEATVRRNITRRQDD